MLPLQQPSHNTSPTKDTSSSHPRPADVNDQEQPRKRTRCLRSCLACRRSKQRCQFPDPSIEPSNDPLPSHLACKRCLLIDNDCFVVDTAPRPSPSTTRPRGDSRVLQPQTPHHNASNAALPRHGHGGAPESWIDGAQQCIVPLARQESPSKEYIGDRSALLDSSTSPPPVNDLRIFDPEVAETSKGKSEKTFLEKTPGQSATLPKKTMDWVKVGMTVCRPFELLGYLLRKQSISRHLFAEGLRPLDTLANLTVSVSDLRSRYEQEVEALQIGMPFLPLYEEVLRARIGADLLLGVVLYMSHSNRQETDAQARLAPVLRQHCLSCVLHQPRNVYDIISLVIVALHLPLLLGSLSDGNSLDGAGLLTSAASASQSFGLDKAIARLASATHHNIISPEIRNACLWTALGLYTSFAALAGDVERQPIIRCTSEDLDALEVYSQAACISPDATLQSRQRCASVSLLIYRMRATNDIRQVAHNCATLMKIHREDIDRTSNIAILQSTCNEAKVTLQRCCDALKRLQHPLASKLTSYGWQRNYCIDVLGLDLALLQLLCLSRFTEKLFERSPRLIGHESSPTDLLALLRADMPLTTLYSGIGCHRADIAKRVLSLFINVFSYATRQKSYKNNATPPLSLVKSIPPTHLCSSLVMAAQAITEELDGRIADGQSPFKKIGDSTIEMTEMILDGTKQILMQFSETDDSPPFFCAKKAAHQGNLFVLSARLIDSLTCRLAAWKGVAYNLGTSNGKYPSDTDEVSHISSEGFSPENFDDLFQEILATPIDFLEWAV